MKAAGSKIKCQDMVCTNMRMGLFTKGSGKTTSIMAEASMSSLMGLTMKATGRIILCMEPAGTSIAKAETGRGSFDTVSSKVSFRNSWPSKGS